MGIGKQWLLAIAAASLALHTPAGSQSIEPGVASSFFRQAAIADVEAAASLLEENHPGAAPEMGDEHFREMLGAAHRLARGRAEQVADIEGYLAVMAGFSNMLDDKHLSFKPGVVVSRPSWVGLIIGLRGGRWVVVDEEPWPGRAPLAAAVLEDCDGISAEEIARERLGGFRADWSIPAQRGLAAPWLLVDERNPFLKPLRECRFSVEGLQRTIRLDWQPIPRDTIIARVNHAAGIGAAGYGVRRFDSGWWISIGELTGRAPAVIEQARRLRTELRTAPFVIIDVRGNGGGASDIGDQLAVILYGDHAIPSVGDCPTPWRVSPDNLARIESYPRLLGSQLSPQARSAIDADIAAMRRAAASGRPFSRPLAQCSEQRFERYARPRVFILTDRVCFSSCLIVVRTFRSLGAVQIGEQTNANTRYQENRRVQLPSGLGTIGVQATVDLTQPPRVGPFQPELSFDGDLTDTDAVEAWIRSSVVAYSAGDGSPVRASFR